MNYFKQFPLKFWLLCLSTFFFFISFNIIIPEMPEFITKLGGEDYKGFIIGMFTLSAMLARPISGKLSDHIGRVPIMIVGAVFSALAGLLYSFAATVWVFLLIRFVHGFSAGFKPTGTVAYAADIIEPHRRGESMAVLGLMNNFGFFTGVGLSSIVKNALGFNGLFLASAFLALLSIAILARLKETLPDPEPLKKSHFRIRKEDLFDRRVWKPALVTILTVCGFGAILTVIPDYSIHLGIQNKGAFMMVSTVGSLLVRFFSGKLSDRIGRKQMLLIGTVLWIIGLMFLYQASQPILFFTAAFFVGTAVGFNSPSFFAWVIDISDGKNTGRAMSTLFIMLEIGIMYGAFLSAEIYGNDPSRLGLSFLFVAIFHTIALAFIVSWIILEKRKLKS